MRVGYVVAVVLLSQSAALAQGVPEKAERIIDRAARALADEADRLLQVGKDKDAEAYMMLVKDLDSEIVKRRDTPDAVKVRQALFAKRLVGNWSRLTFPDRYVVQPDGTIKAFKPDGGQSNDARFQKFLSENAVEYKWATGHVWHIHGAGPNVLAVTEVLADVRTGDGIVLERK